MPRKLTDRVKRTRMLKKILQPNINHSSKFINPTIIIYKTNMDSNNVSIFQSYKKEKLKIYKSRTPFRILPFVRSELKLYKSKKHNIILLDTHNSSKDLEEIKCLPVGINIVCKNNNQIKLVGAGAIGNWITIPESNKIFKTMYSRTGNKTMSEYMIKNKIKTNYKHKKKIYKHNNKDIKIMQ